MTDMVIGSTAARTDVVRISPEVSPSGRRVLDLFVRLGRLLYTAVVGPCDMLVGTTARSSGTISKASPGGLVAARGIAGFPHVGP